MGTIRIGVKRLLCLGAFGLRGSQGLEQLGQPNPDRVKVREQLWELYKQLAEADEYVQTGGWSASFSPGDPPPPRWSQGDVDALRASIAEVRARLADM